MSREETTHSIHQDRVSGTEDEDDDTGSGTILPVAPDITQFCKSTETNSTAIYPYSTSTIKVFLFFFPGSKLSKMTQLV